MNVKRWRTCSKRRTRRASCRDDGGIRERVWRMWSGEEMLFRAL